MRFYSFTNMYFNGIHAGIQTAHAVHAMESRYRHLLESVEIDDPYGDKYLQQLDAYLNWSDNHKTIIVKNGGNHESLINLFGALEQHAEQLGLPTVMWCEPDANYCVTAVGIVLPESVYNWKDPNLMAYSGMGQVLMSPGLSPPETTEQSLYKIINNYRFAT